MPRARAAARGREDNGAPYCEKNFLKSSPLLSTPTLPTNSFSDCSGEFPLMTDFATAFLHSICGDSAEAPAEASVHYAYVDRRSRYAEAHGEATGEF